MVGTTRTLACLSVCSMAVVQGEYSCTHTQLVRSTTVCGRIGDVAEPWSCRRNSLRAALGPVAGVSVSYRYSVNSDDEHNVS